MTNHLLIQPVGARATISNHFTIPAQPPSPPSSSDSEGFTPNAPRRPVPKAMKDLWTPVEPVCSRVLREKINGKDGTLYSLGEPFGRGAFGDVFAARALRPDGRRDLVCLKRVVVERRDPFALGGYQPSAADNEANAMLAAETWLGPKALMYDIAIDGRENNPTDDVSRVDYAYIEEVLCHGNMLHAADQFDNRHPECLELMVLSLLEQTSRRLGVLHKKGWVHRDIKPENLLFMTEHKDVDDKPVYGEIFVGDYGRGRIARQQPQRLAGLGTPGFFSPQAAVGPCRPGDDIWSLAVTCIELLMAENPFDPTPYVEHPKDSDGKPVRSNDTKLQMPHYTVSRDLLRAYEDWFKLENKPTEHRLTEVFTDLFELFPRAASVLQGMLHPDINQRSSAPDVFKAVTREGGVGLTKSERRKLNRAWADIEQHPRIVAQRDKLSEAHEPLQHSRTFDNFEISSGFDHERQRRDKGIAAGVDGLAEKLAHTDLAEHKASFERKYAQRYASRPTRRAVSLRTGQSSAPRISYAQVARRGLVGA